MKFVNVYSFCPVKFGNFVAIVFVYYRGSLGYKGSNLYQNKLIVNDFSGLIFVYKKHLFLLMRSGVIKYCYLKIPYYYHRLSIDALMLSLNCFYFVIQDRFQECVNPFRSSKKSCDVIYAF